MDDFARAYRASGGDYDDRPGDLRPNGGSGYGRGRRSDLHPYGSGDYDRPHRRSEDPHPYGGGDYNRGARNELVLYTGGAGASDHARGYRNEFRSIGGGRGDRRLEIVQGNVFSANQTYVTGAHPSRAPDPPPLPPSRRNGGAIRPYSSFSSSSGGSGAWCFSDPEMKRRRRVANYKVYSVEGKVKHSIRKSFRWIKGKCSQIVHGW